MDNKILKLGLELFTIKLWSFVSPPLPSFRDAALEFDAKMDEYGFERSRSPRNTEPDGNCAVYGNI